MYMYDNLIPLAFALAIWDDDISFGRFSRLTEAEKEHVLYRAMDSKSADKVEVILNELSMDDRIF